MCCCDAWLIARNECDGTPYNKVTHFCCSNTLYEKTEFNDCCMGELYDKRSAFCWIGLRLTSYMLNCNGKQYNYRQEKCCGGKIMPNRDPALECCVDQIIDTSKYVCQSGGAVPL
ncbi:hypothetical protein LSAT2_026092 [Lamellibrachia satsuma]|nr:hypothetical protein LSAT2_026092 [Lamellibrachia satsuma]